MARAEQVFVLNRDRFETRLTTVFTQEGLPASDAECVAKGIVDQGSDKILVYARLGVQRPEYTRLRTRVEVACSV